MATKKKSQPIINNTDREIETSEGWIIPSKNYEPQLSFYHKDAKIYILKKDGFRDLTIGRMFGEWEYLDYVYIHTLYQVWKKLDMSLFPKELIENEIKKWSVRDES